MTLRAQLARAALAAALAVAFDASQAQGVTPEPASAAKPAGNWREASLAEYRQHLVELGAVVEACAKARDTKACDPALVGQDDHVPLTNAPNAERRLVGYAWVRALLSMAQLKDESPEKPQNKAQDKRQGKTDNTSQGESKAHPMKARRTPLRRRTRMRPRTKLKTRHRKSRRASQPPLRAAKERDLSEEPTRPPKPTTSQLLEAAEARLTQDIAQADAAAASVPAPAVDHSHERDAMKQVLAGPTSATSKPPTARDSALEKLGQWLNRLLASAGKLRVHAAWVGRLIVWGFILAVCVGLVWGLMQLERRWRIRLVPDTDAPAAGAASARDWQLWLEDARQLRRRRTVARSGSLRLLGCDFTARIQAPLAG